MKTFVLFQKKAQLVVLEQEQARAREEALHQEKLREEERRLSGALEECKGVRSENMHKCLM